MGCTWPRAMRKIVVTGGPGAGKTASIELARRALCEHVGFARESASIVFGGGFPRETRVQARCAAQRAIFQVQHELEAVFADRADLDVLICDRGSLDCAAYWPRDEDPFYAEVRSDRVSELARYATVIHLRTPPGGDGYERGGLRVETAAEAARMDARIEHAWRGHPRRFFVEHTHDFLEKARQVLAIVCAELVCPHPQRAA